MNNKNTNGLIACYWHESGVNQIYTFEEIKKEIMDELDYYKSFDQPLYIKYTTKINNALSWKELEDIIEEMNLENILDMSISNVRTKIND